MLGSAQRNLKMIREAFNVTITARDRMLQLAGDETDVAAARLVLDDLADAARTGRTLSRADVLHLLADASARAEKGQTVRRGGSGNYNNAAHLTQQISWDDSLDVYSNGRLIRPRSDNQSKYLEAIRTNDLVFGIGPAGTGKTYLAVAAAAHLLKTDSIRKVVLVRPAVEAGEKLGFLPGDMEAKVNPYLRPLFDALHDMMDFATIKRFMLHDVVEVAPLAFMRGRTLNHSMIILDEAQNTTASQMMMFLTRMGQGSKMVVTGDMTQTDLPDPSQSGLADAVHRLQGVAGVSCVELDQTDIVRHDLVQRIVQSYAEGTDAVSGADPPRSPTHTGPNATHG